MSASNQNAVGSTRHHPRPGLEWLVLPLAGLLFAATAFAVYVALS